MPDDPSPAGLGTVRTERFTFADLPLAAGGHLPEVTLAYETYGRLAADGRNAVLVTHGFTSSHHAAGRNPENDGAPGWWDGLIGPGKAIDTDRLYVVASNMLGSSAGSTNARSTDPRTGRPYGPDFPSIRLADIVAAQRRLVDHLGIRHLVAVAGQSYGGFQALQWGIDHPGFMDALVVAVSAPQTQSKTYDTLRARLAADPDWRDGRYDPGPGPVATMRAIREETLARYGMAEMLAARGLDPAAREAEIRRMAAAWAAKFDARSLLILREAADLFEATPQLGRIRAKVLYAIGRTDVLFPPAIVPRVMAAFAAAGVDARYVEIDSDFGHLAAGADAAKWSAALSDFLRPWVP